ncbi:hypothetical protein [Salicola sp. Rm-C-2C1-2]|uniref:hypothetical protein n=1 Tax=Salicola sp. Rm-C-2C1-2 TaxID=3141321 RepID=UPI0032E48674
MATSDSGSPPTEAPVRNVVIFDVDEGGFATARRADLGRWLRRALDETLTDAGRTLADRNLAQVLKEETERAEMGNAGTYEGAPIAGFAVRTKITQADFSQEFNPAYTNFAGFDVSAECEYASCVKVTVDVYTVPELERVKDFRNQASGSKSEEVDTESDCREMDPRMLRRTSRDAMAGLRESLQNYFASPGHVLAAYDWNGPMRQGSCRLMISEDNHAPLFTGT